MGSFENTNWWKYADPLIRDLMRGAYVLLEREKAIVDGLHDYSFIVFPAAKAYEGFLKKLFLDLGLISRQQYYGEYFRIGKALSPSLPKRYRSGWVFGKLAGVCGGEELPLKMWQVWKRARNRIFHFFPDHREFITLAEAEELLAEITGVMDDSLAGCRRHTGFSLTNG
ncbi:hypothetical protein A3H89_00330 [Candidatus Amesbacteria bacterium RIFCSPLOWO2_02_FULL_48_11]|uniref:Bacterial toxin RNase RnlA/LsoA DBD domain-containing protein n=4 Tax=Candidatus Amesiibacteriota TaxID=1752730 RepID=A0A1F4Z8N9_9BACT|nr:MAG: hypothetical protein UX78_C0005G0064 [Candidatus Amesbacteria bacterium GW2011_GWA2_47_11]KKU93758.1 MAG: hypothetical protein UY22_C0017G0015 [Candidatus Amesbacteria bacterium GW2011_GWC1_48_10]KKU99552.1 MAG: hypothetical protein UY33_C0028G0006 [Candidatus Amesbacteria bacterium GW2011_GWA1_48_9]OGC90004.1 MAG: hypothetical protein A2V48_01185 [Candidatus Amesbacteria bacterium RBG_19FT_COMBO_48_16]OGC96211.1 MAG: hypothetical protein A3C34_02395 [Candidatus Amesbacteria bacterium R